MEKLPCEDALNYAIDRFAKKENPTRSDLAQVRVVADIQRKLLEYEAQGKGMTGKELTLEKHNSTRLAEHMQASGDPRPNKYCHCHAIVSGGHAEAAEARAILAYFKMRVDSNRNGCWLPANTKSLTQMPSKLRRAVPHSRIHRYGYYFWLNRAITHTFFNNETELSDSLRHIRHKLETSTFPEYVMLKAHEVRTLEEKGNI